MNVAFLGTPRPAVPFLEALVRSGQAVRLVVTRADKPSGRSGRPQPPPVKLAAEALGLAVVQPRSVRTEAFAETLRQAAPDVLVVVAYGRILPAAVLEAAPRGAINVHFSLLPKYRGAAPVQWALANGERVTGVTTMRLDEGLDTGDVLLARETEIRPGEHAPALFDRLAALGVDLLLDTLAALERGELRPRPQDHAAASHAPLLTPEDGAPAVDLPAAAIEGRVRGFDPWPGVWFRRAGRRLRIVEARAVQAAAPESPPGRVLGRAGDAVRVAFGGGTVLEVLAIQPDGRRVVSARDALNGRLIEAGDDLTQA